MLKPLSEKAISGIARDLIKELGKIPPPIIYGQRVAQASQIDTLRQVESDLSGILLDSNLTMGRKLIMVTNYVAELKKLAEVNK